MKREHTYCPGLIDYSFNPPLHLLCYRKGCKKYGGLCKMHAQRLSLQNKNEDLVRGDLPRVTTKETV